MKYFVRLRIAMGMFPEDICEQLMTDCLAPDCLMGGLGGDNMTVVLVCFLHNKPYEDLVKRCAAALNPPPYGAIFDSSAAAAAAAAVASANASDGADNNGEFTESVRSDGGRNSKNDDDDDDDEDNADSENEPDLK